MLSQPRFSYLIEISQKMIEAVKVMRTCYQALPPLIEEEHAMIREHTYTPRLEQIAQDKMEFGLKIEASFEELQQLSQELFGIWNESDCEGQAAFPGDLSNCIAMLAGIHKALSVRESGLALNVLEIQVQRLRETVETFKACVDVIKPKLELNRLAISQVARNYQESTRILFEMCEAAQATYTAQGQQAKASTGSSTIVVKA
jgi:hypothetical protein